MKTFKSICLILALSLPLISCGGGSTTPEGPPIEQISFYRVVDAGPFTMQVPEDWETIQTFPTNYPENTVVAFRNNVQDHEFIANINVVRNTVDEGTISSDYAIQMFETLQNQLINFKKIEEEEYYLFIGGEPVKTYLYEFEGINDTKEEILHFMQLSGVTGTTAFVITGAYDKNDTELAIDQVKQSLQTFYIT